MGKINGNNKIRYNKLVLVFVFFLFCGLIVRMGMLCLAIKGWVIRHYQHLLKRGIL